MKNNSRRSDSSIFKKTKKTESMNEEFYATKEKSEKFNFVQNSHKIE